MLALLLLAFLVMPFAELYVIVQVASGLGVGMTILLLLAVSVVGAWLVRREGLSALSRVQAQLAAGQLPTKALIDGLLILVAGALLLTPGFLTDGVGVLLLLPPTRAALRGLLVRRYQSRITTFGVGGATAGAGWAGGDGPGTVWSSSQIIVIDEDDGSGAGDPGPGDPGRPEGRAELDAADPPRPRRRRPAGGG